ncbi:MAG: ABC transporter ATP-binding protein [Bacillota bacterium]|nr:MAG: ABC transporter ATP-binding protein [Bacillota bacterium]
MTDRATHPEGTGRNHPVLWTSNLTKTFFLGRTIYAVKDVNIAVGPAEFAAVVGPSGCGKSTLLGLLGGLDRPVSGDVVLDGQRYSELNENGLALLRRRKIGFVFQFFNLISHLSALENVMLPMRFTGKPSRACRTKAEQLLKIVGLAERKTHLPLQMSGGEQQRVAIARALANDPALVLADEPTGNLDTRTGGEMIHLFERLNRDMGQTFVVVSHDPKLAEVADVVFRMKDGEIVESTRNARGAERRPRGDEHGR